MTHYLPFSSSSLCHSVLPISILPPPPPLLGPLLLSGIFTLSPLHTLPPHLLCSSTPHPFLLFRHLCVFVINLLPLSASQNSSLKPPRRLGTICSGGGRS
ncbi:hypothetical protein XELAEV_18022227mg [Xenopus laevis]|uniref:Uncharacterized protein n=1 Tax=Xenopus laevis TaxID=8355 RepID=A0A974D2S6_XENLA|nr:hypothetical protein XELAEV_18022227mg [Xenopus laevis]